MAAFDRKFRILLATLAALLCAHAIAGDAPPPPKVVLTVFTILAEPEPNQIEVKASVLAKQLKPGQPLATIHIEGTLKDFYGAEVPDGKVAFDIALKQGETKADTHIAKPSAQNVGPFFFTGTWAEKDGTEKGELADSFALPNSRSRIDDFELPKFKPEKDELEYNFAAQYSVGWRGHTGLVLHLPKDLDAGGKFATKRLTFNTPLPGRAARLGLFVHCFGNVQFSAVMQDKGRPDTRTAEPLTLTQADWRYVELPIAPTSKPGEEYRTTLKELVFQGPPGTAIHIDDLDVLTQRDTIVSLTGSDAVVPVSYTGSKIKPNSQPEGITARMSTARVFGACPQPLEFKLRAAALGKDRTIHFSGTVTDYRGATLPKLEIDVTAAAGQAAEKVVTLTVTETNAGPFYVTGTWTEVNSDNSDSVFDVIGHANWRMVLEDFEQVKFPDVGGALESSPLAKHSGELGVIVRPQPLKSAPGAPLIPPGAPSQTNIPLSLTLTGRPVKLGLWIKAPVAAQVRMQLRDPGINHMGEIRYDTWTVGPVDVSAGDWRYVELPMPDYSAPEARRSPSPESNGVVDYPLTLDHVTISGPTNAEILVDDIELWSQAEKTDSPIVRTYSNKPSGLLYRNDAIAVVISNAWLWGEALQVQFNAKLENLFGKQLPLISEGTATIPPGSRHVQRASVTNLPMGPYAFTFEARANGKVIATIPPAKTAENPHPEQNFLVYEPQGKPLAAPELFAILRDRNKLVAELGFRTDNMLFTWHSTQNSPAIENFPGYFQFDWLTPGIQKRTDAGLTVIGTLGFTPQFYDPSARYISLYNEWFGSTVAMPTRSIYFEEYVHRTLEHFAGQVDTWVVWDRPDQANFATPEEYTDKMLEVAKRAATEANPKAKLISGAIPYENLNTYLAGVIEAGGQNYVDGIGIMPSPAPLSPEDGNLDAVLARAQKLRKEEQVKPELWVLNLAWNTGDTQGSVSELNQALYIPRAWVICQAQGINNILVQPDGTQTIAEKNSADLIYPIGEGFAIKPAAIATKTVSTLMKDATIVREVFLNDRCDGLARAYLFKRPDGTLLLASWRREGTSVLPFTTRPDAIYDTFGNSVDAGESPQLTLRPAPQYALFSNSDATTLIRQLERAVIVYDDAPESAWKTQFSFYLDVGDAEDEKAAQYAATESHLVGPVDSYYFSEYGRHIIDTGRHFKGQESFSVDVSKFGNADLMLRKRINYSVRNQLVKVYCNDQFVGQWCAPLADRRYRWRDIEYIIPNSFFAGKPSATLRFVNAGAPDSEATSYCYWGGPLRSRKIYASDLSLLCGTAGPAAPFISRDKNVIGSAMSFLKKPETVRKGLGTNSGAKLDESLIVLCLNKQYKTLHGVVGIDNCTNGRGTVRFYVGGLNKKTLFDSNYMTAYSEPKTFDLDVSDQISIMLWVNDGGDGRDDDIANWADLHLELK